MKALQNCEETTINSEFVWLRFQQLIPWELEDSYYWFLQDLGITRFCFESSPSNPDNKTIFIWLPLLEWPFVERQQFVNSLKKVVNTFDVVFPEYKWKEINDEDWSFSWKKNWLPDPIGESLLILPAWMKPTDQFINKKIIRLDPGAAFGTGSHSTTRLCLESLEKEIINDMYIADLGCGSGILSITALSLGAKYVSGVDIDPLAVSSCKRNFELNKFAADSFDISLGSIEVLELQANKKKFDLLLCNTLAPILKSLCCGFGTILSPQGKAFLSGLLLDQVGELRDVLEGLGWIVSKTIEKDRWALIEICRKSDISSTNSFK